MYSGVCEVNSPFVQESVSTISNSTLKVCPLVTEASVISGFFDYMNTQIYVSFKLNQSNCIGLYSSVHCFLSVCEDCIKVNNEVGVMSHLKHIVSGNFLVKLLISQQVMILSLHTFMSVSYGVSIVENLILNSVIQCKLFTSIITTSQCENLLCRKLLKVKQQRCFWFDWFYHSIMITFSFIGAKISVAGFKSDDQWSLVGIFLALTTCSCIFLYKNHKSR
ncbi:unnamed protein product [Heterobilharzia americana]|nr:unnamed protein product [Heterobilharzia americana]